jgi:hypothetical protein
MFEYGKHAVAIDSELVMIALRSQSTTRMSNEDRKSGSTKSDEESVETLTDFIDQLEQKAFMRSLDQRHPVDDTDQSLADVKSS